MKLVSRLFDEPVRTAELDPRAVSRGLLPSEELAVARAVEKRRREFTAGRVCAREAMAALGHRPDAILVGEDRAPLWPDGLVGSITHTSSWCAAAVARTEDGILSLGLDIEPDDPLKPSLVRTITVDSERAFLEDQPEAERGLAAKVIFSAKECAYKCQYPLTRCFFGFQGMQIRLDLRRGAFSATFLRDAGRFSRGDVLPGRVLIDHGYVMTAMALEGTG